MAQYASHLLRRTAVREVHLEQLESGVIGLNGYQRALVVFRRQGTVVGRAWLPVTDGTISIAKLRTCLPAVSWPVWQQLCTPALAPDRPTPSASVVVCTRDRPEELRHCLKSLAPLAEQGHQVIVVDNCPSDDRTARLMDRYPTIHYLCEPRPGLDVARNAGLEAATGEIVAFTDDDAHVDAGWLSALLRNFDDPMVAVVTGLTLPAELETEAQIRFERTNGFGRGFGRWRFDMSNTPLLGSGRVGAGVNMAVRRNALEEIGLFDEALDCGTPTCSGGDQEFLYRVLAHGHRIVYEPAALVWHRHRRDRESLRRTIYGYGVGVLAWWTRALLVEKEWTVLKVGVKWFLEHYVRNLVRALRRRRGHVPLDLAWAEFRGALAGPVKYLQSRRWLREQRELYAHTQTARVKQMIDVEADQTPSTAASHKPALAGKGLEVP